MKEIGKVVKIEEDQATILITRGTACGDCGKCQVGRDKLEMIMTADNNVGAQVGDEVEIELENMKDNSKVAVEADYVVLALGVAPDRKFVENFKSNLDCEVSVIGDAAKGGRIYDAMLDGYGKASIFNA